MLKSRSNIFFDEMLFMPPEFFAQKLQLDSSVFRMVAFFTFFNEKNYVYNISNTDFIRASDKQMQRFFDQSTKHKEFYSDGLHPRAGLRKLRRCRSIKPDSGNMTSLEELPELYQLKSNKLTVFLIFRQMSRFSREYVFHMELVRCVSNPSDFEKEVQDHVNDLEMEFHHLALSNMIDAYSAEYPFVLRSDFAAFRESLTECRQFTHGNEDYIKFNR